MWLVLTSRQSGAAIATPELGKVKITPVRLAEPKAPSPPPQISKPAPRRIRPPVAARVVVPPSTVRTPTARPAVPNKVAPFPAREPRPAKATARPPLIPEAYPRAVTSSRQPRTPSKPKTPASPRRTSPETAPLWTSEAPPTEPVQTGQGDKDGIVVEPQPIGRVDLSTPGFMALKRADIVARFEIAADGSVTDVTLVPGTGIPTVDVEVIAYCKTIRWAPKTVGGVAVAGVQELDFSKDNR